MDGTMLTHLAWAARTARETAGATTHDIAALAHIDVSSVRRFERARAWPRDPDLLIAAYARQASTTARHIWAAALAHWT
jgi:hypothetical protein